MAATLAQRHSARLSCCIQARLAGGEWVALLPEEHAGLPEVKWSPNRMRPFLCIGPAADAAPGAREAEEFIEARMLRCRLQRR